MIIPLIIYITMLLKKEFHQGFLQILNFKYKVFIKHD